MPKPTPELPPTPENLLPDEALVEGHHPTGLSATDAAKIVADSLSHQKPCEMIVLAADIRKSTFLMKEAASFALYANITGMFVEASAEIIRESGGWFDKFTGDGFLAYWPTEGNDWSKEISQLMTISHRLLLLFQDRVMPDYRRNSKNFPGGVGLSLGIDAGAAHFANIAGDLTIVGDPVVGAVRMVSCAQPWELVANVYVGEALFSNRGQFVESDVELTREYRSTKEYETQEVYPILFKKRVGISS